MICCFDAFRIPRLFAIASTLHFSSCPLPPLLDNVLISSSLAFSSNSNCSTLCRKEVSSFVNSLAASVFPIKDNNINPSGVSSTYHLSKLIPFHAAYLWQLLIQGIAFSGGRSPPCRNATVASILRH